MLQRSHLAHLATIAVALLAGCGLDLAGAKFVVGNASPDAGDRAFTESGVSAIGAMGVDASFDEDAGPSMQTLVAMPDGGPIDPNAGDDAARPQAPSPATNTSSAQPDGGGVAPSPPDDRGDSGAAQPLDAGTAGQGPCARLLDCCPRLVVAPPVALACYATAEADAGDGRACDTALGTLTDAGVCM
jgi:hypothetical protein